MQSYINLILDELEGDTSGEKLQSLKKLKDERSTYYSKANHAYNNFKALSETPGLENIKSLLEALSDTTKVCQSPNEK